MTSSPFPIGRSIRVLFKLSFPLSSLFLGWFYNVWKPQLFAGVRKDGSNSPLETNYLVQNSPRKSLPDLTTRRSWTTPALLHRVPPFPSVEGVEGEVAGNDCALPVIIGYSFVPFLSILAEGLSKGEKDGNPASRVVRKD